MYLKKLSLSGFKSFANATELEFGQGITAIVGPNGSGKSNIVDALMWAMGERSTKALRGHSSTDVIFSGSGSRKPLGLAEVTLTFDNEDGSLPIDFKEVQVGRKLFRDGDSVYAINKSKCRMRDILDLFLDTGVGPESFSIISQGEIDAILSAKPEDRRNLIEGAAGVQKYHSRRQETRRKLDRVQVDLQRVADITFELEGQLGPLSQQAELALEYDNYVERLRVLQLAILARDFELRTKRLEESREGHAQSTINVRDFTAHVEKLEASKITLEEKMRGYESTFDRVQTDLTSAMTRLKATEGEIAVSHERRRALTEQQEFQAREIGMLRERINATRQKMDETKAQWQEAKKSQSDLSESAAAAEKLMGEANAELSEATRLLQSLQAQVIERMRESQQKREAAATSRAESAGLENRQRELEKLQEELAHENAQLTAAQQKTAAETESAKERHAAAAQSTEKAHQVWQQSQNAQRQLNENLSTLREKRSGTQSRLRALQELEDNLEGVAGGSRAVLKAVKNRDLPDQYTLVADAVRSPKEVELAVEVALGAGVHNLICERDSEAKTAINWLKDRRAGRATFLPIQNLRPGHISERTKVLLSRPGVRGMASQLVSSEPHLQAAVDYLLGRVMIVDTLDIAVTLAKQCDNGIRLVTLEGELVLPSGAITGGAGKQKTSGLLARKRELEELEKQIQAIAKNLEESQQLLAEAAAEVEARQKDWHAAQEAAQEIRSQSARLERETEHLQSEVKRQEQRKNAVTSQINQVRQQITDRSAHLQEHEKLAGEMEDAAGALDQNVTAAQEAVTAKQARREEISSEVAEVRAGYSASQERLRAMEREIKSAADAIKDFESQITSKQKTIEAAAGEDAALVTRETDLVSLLTELQGQHERLEKELAEVRAARSEALQQLQDNDKTLREKRTALHQSEEELHKLEVRIASTEAEIAGMQRRFEEEFKISQEEALTYRDAIEQKNLAQDEIQVLRDKIDALGEVNTGAVAQYEQVKERLEFLTSQRADLDKSREELEAIITDIDARTHERFMTTFNAIKEAFEDLFKRVFDGGSTHLTLTDPENLLETGIDLRVQLPGKAKQDISLLSGGERALTALSFMLALLRVHPSPFVVLDEVDAPLDQSNVTRFSQLLREFTDKTQFIIITHNNGTMQASDVLYGVTQQEQGISTLMSVRLADDEEMAASESKVSQNGKAAVAV